MSGRGGYGGGGRGGGRGRGGGDRFKVLNKNFMGQGGGGAAKANPNAEIERENAIQDERERQIGFDLFTDGDDKLGWLLNINTTSLEDKESAQIVSAVACYFMCQDGSMFKAKVIYAPYLYLQCKDNSETEVDTYLKRTYGGKVKSCDVVHREDLDLKNHLAGMRRQLLKVSFFNVQQLMDVKRDLMDIIRKNKASRKNNEAYAAYNVGSTKIGKAARVQDALESIEDMKEYDVPYHQRFAIDMDVRCGQWFMVSAAAGRVSLSPRKDLLQRAEPRICAFDIETTKLPLQFPNAEFDQVFMISYMIDRQGYLIVNREVVTEDIDSFEYTPKPEFEGPFEVFNEANEHDTLRRWFDHMRQVKPAIYVTYNGDFFDWPFIETRAEKHGMNMHDEITFTRTKSGECLSNAAIHMDCFAWVNRDSYLPQGSRGLKAVTKAKLGYDPVEVPPEDMLRMAQEEPQGMASYSVSDAVSTYYLYMTYIHPFIFSLATIIPMPPDEVLRKGSGTLCETLLMVEAYKANVIAPNKHQAKSEQFHEGHLLESETYIGGHVEALESGVFRADLPTRFKCTPSAYQGLIDNLDRDLSYAITVECKTPLDQVTNYDDIKAQIQAKLEELRDTPNREECPVLYHLDVAAMYPNIILTNRLQPPAVVTEEDCAACDFNKPGKTCLRTMEWVWRGEHYAASRSEYLHIKNQLESEMMPPEYEDGPKRFFRDLPYDERQKMIKARFKAYNQKVYKRAMDKPKTEVRTAGVCMRENDFYIGTVRAFRDRRYEYKGLNKVWKGRLDDAKEVNNPIKVQEASDMVVLYDSLQLAHKCILNSFYGYVMRKGARWYSMEMAGVVTYTGARIIQAANALIEQLGKPLELDTDGIWCALPGSFPENYKFETTKGKPLKVSYPCVMLNVMVATNNTNDQYQTLVDPAKREYKVSSEMSIEFEVDGPYQAMVLPAAKEEDKTIKKRYAVFNFDGSLAELKGFELKRRGELKLVKVFQAEVFKQFLEGSTLEECYAAVAKVADRWLDMLDTQGNDLTDDELLEYISESTVMSKTIEEYEGRKSAAITTAKRLGQFLGDERLKDKGLVCHYIIAKEPAGGKTTDRAVPIAIFQAEPAVSTTYLRRWCKSIQLIGEGPDARPDVRSIVDWDYYRERLGSAIMKIITIPAAMQRVPNPVPRVRHPDWLLKRVRDREDKCRQRKLADCFRALPAPQPGAANKGDLMDIEDMGASIKAKQVPRTARVTTSLAGKRTVPPLSSPSQANVVAEHVRPDGEEEKENAAPAPGEDPIEGEEGIQEGARPHKKGRVAQEEDQAAGPTRQEDYKGWLAHAKACWRRQREQRKEAEKDRKERETRRAQIESQGMEVEPSVAPRRQLSIFHKQHSAASAFHWQILHLAPTHQPGLYKAWVLLGSDLYAVPLRVPRRFYVNTSLDPQEAEDLGLCQRTSRLLPPGHIAENVYEVLMDEAQFRANRSNLAAQLSTNTVHATLEDRLPLDLHATLMLGCCTTVANKGARSRPLSREFSVDELAMKTTTECGYLLEGGAEGLGPLRYASLYHSADVTHRRATFCLLLPATKRAIVQLVNPVAGAPEEVSSRLCVRKYKEAMDYLVEDMQRSGLDFPVLKEMDVEVHYSTTEQDATRQLARALADFRETHKAPTLMVLETPMGLENMMHEMPILAEFPSVSVTANSNDSDYPTLGWQQHGAIQAVQRVAVHRQLLHDLIQAARYAHAPIGNMGREWMISTADLLFSRCLRDAGHCLWAADPSLLELVGQPPKEIYGLQDDAWNAHEVMTPGAYREVCVELKLQNLAASAIDNAVLLSELEGTNSELEGDAFKVLKQLVTKWIQDATERGSRYADMLLSNLQRWLSTTTSLLHDPSLQRSLHIFMQKCFLQLVAELRRLGAVVVAGDFGSLTICTGKHNLSAAVGYTSYLIDALSRKELFKWLQLSPIRHWHTLVYRDRWNYAGIMASIPADVTPEAAAEAETQQDSQDVASTGYVDQWDIMHYLPPALQSAFRANVMDFIVRPWMHVQEDQLEGASQGGTQAAAESQAKEAAMAAFLRERVKGFLSERLLQHAHTIQQQVGAGADEPRHQFPERAGSHLSPEELGTPVLAYVKSICAIMELDSRVEEEVALMRRNLLRMIHCREFSKEATFSDPCRSFVLRDVICTYCNDCCDLDVCRNADVQEKNWVCRMPGCRQRYDRDVIEERLVMELQKLAASYQLQDLKCRKCKQASSGHMDCRCSCGGFLDNTLPADQHSKDLAVFSNVAKFHEFSLLGDLADWLVSM